MPTNDLFDGEAQKPYSPSVQANRPATQAEPGASTVACSPLSQYCTPGRPGRRVWRRSRRRRHGRLVGGVGAPSRMAIPRSLSAKATSAVPRLGRAVLGSDQADGVGR